MHFKCKIKLQYEAINLSLSQDTLITNGFNAEHINIYEINIP